MQVQILKKIHINTHITIPPLPFSQHLENGEVNSKSGTHPDESWLEIVILDVPGHYGYVHCTEITLSR